MKECLPFTRLCIMHEWTKTAPRVHGQFNARAIQKRKQKKTKQQERIHKQKTKSEKVKNYVEKQKVDTGRVSNPRQPPHPLVSKCFRKCFQGSSQLTYAHGLLPPPNPTNYVLHAPRPPPPLPPNHPSPLHSHPLKPLLTLRIPE